MENLMEYNKEIFRLLKEREALFKHYSSYCNMNPTEHWIIYTLYYNETSSCGEKIYYTQKELSDLWAFPTQTINTAVKKLEKQNFIYLEKVKGSRRKQYVKLSEEGFKIGEKIMQPLIDVEIGAFKSFNEEELSEFLRLFKKWKDNLEDGIEKISHSHDESDI